MVGLDEFQGGWGLSATVEGELEACGCVGCGDGGDACAHEVDGEEAGAAEEAGDLFLSFKLEFCNFGAGWARTAVFDETVWVGEDREKVHV